MSNQVTFRLDAGRREAFRIALVRHDVGIQHFLDAVTDLLIDDERGKCDARTSTVIRRLMERARALKAKRPVG